MILLPYHDYQKWTIALCNFIEKRETFQNKTFGPSCIGKTKGSNRGEWKRMPISIDNCDPSVVNEMPNIKLQFDQYNFDIRPKMYLDYMRISNSRRMVDVNDTMETGICTL